MKEVVFPNLDDITQVKTGLNAIMTKLDGMSTDSGISTDGVLSKLDALSTQVTNGGSKISGIESVLNTVSANINTVNTNVDTVKNNVNTVNTNVNTVNTKVVDNNNLLKNGTYGLSAIRNEISQTSLGGGIGYGPVKNTLFIITKSISDTINGGVWIALTVNGKGRFLGVSPKYNPSGTTVDGMNAKTYPTGYVLEIDGERILDNPALVKKYGGLNVWGDGYYHNGDNSFTSLINKNNSDYRGFPNSGQYERYLQWSPSGYIGSNNLQQVSPWWCYFKTSLKVGILVSKSSNSVGASGYINYQLEI